MGRRSLAVAVIVALLLATAALAFRLLRDGPGGSPAGGSGTEFLPILFAAAGLCAAGLLRHRAPAGAWLASVAVAGIATLEILGAVRARQVTMEHQAWPSLVFIAEAALLAAAAIAAGYALARRGDREEAARAPAWRRRWWPLIVYGGLAVVAVTGAWSTVQEANATGVALDPASADLPPLRISARMATGYVAVMALAGIWLDLRGPLGRARAKSASAAEFPRALADELLPNAAAARRHGRDEERARLAADLHALVLPDLRRAAQTVEAAETAETANAAEAGWEASASTVHAHPVAADLRQAVEGVERLMHERQSIVLEEYGLVAGLEWLAERTQRRSNLIVDIELDGADAGAPGAVDLPVARAAFRVALLALDNVVRHAGAARAVIRLELEAGRGRMTVADDGRGIEDARVPRGGRGLVDMRSAAAEVGARFTVERRDRGTAVDVAWDRRPGTAEDSATLVEDSTDRSAAPGP